MILFALPAMYHLIKQTDPSESTRLMILGPAYSVASELMGKVAQRYMDLTQIGNKVTTS